MNAYMNIQVRVLSKAAQGQVKALQAQVAGLEKQLAMANATASSGGLGGRRATQSLTKWGSQLQWTGRQLQYNFTLPLLLAGGAATKFALDNEKAFTHVTKVYGDVAAASDFFMKKYHGMTREMAQQKATQVFTEELNALKGAFEELSTHYGVAQKEVLEVAGAWAQAGSSGLALAKSVDLTMQAMILGQMEAGKATESLIAIQSQYSLSTDQLRLTLAELNSIENQTGISMEGLITGFSRAAGVAREAGIDVRHLGALLAALVPATGTASQAGNALKTVISRLMSPTKEASQVMKEMGLNITALDWQSSTAIERLQMMSEKFRGLSDSQKQVASSVIASRWQINKFNVLMRELGPSFTYYEKALDATQNKARVFAAAQKELNAVLNSSPKRLEIIWRSLQNGMADAVQPLIPYLLYLANAVRLMVEKFSNLDPHLQKFILLSLLALAAVGPLAKLIGSSATLVGTLGQAFRWVIPRMLGFYTVSASINGQQVLMRKNLFMTAAAWLAWPFKIVAAGFGSIVGAIKLATRMLGVHAAATFAWGKLQALALAGARVVHNLFWTGVIQLWIKGYKALIILATERWAAIAGLFARGSVASAAAMKLGMIVGNMQLLFSALMLAAKEGLARLAMLFITFGARANIIFPQIWVAIMAGFAAFQEAMIGAWIALRAGISMVWTLMYVNLTKITAFGSAKIGAIWTAFSTKLAPLVAFAGRAVTAVWAAMHVAMAAVSRVFWTSMIRMWMLGMTGLLKAPGKLAFGLKAIWGNIVLAIKLFGKQILRTVLGPWGWAVAGVLSLVMAFRKQIGQIWSNIVAYFSDSSNGMVEGIVKAWNLLPSGVANALTAVARIVHDAAMQIYEWFSYINPFARHSPSLVENVRNGMAEVRAEFANVSGIGNSLKGAYRDILAFGTAVAKLTGGARSFQQAQQRAKIKEYAPGALASYDQLNNRLKTVTAALGKMAGMVRNQEAVVDRWTKKLDAANAALDKQQSKLDKLQAVADKWSSKLDEAKDRLAYYASAPIKGMGEMEDAIFANEMAQKKLRLEMLKMGDSGNIDDMKNKLALLQGEIEKVNGTKSDLRASGAGSDILSKFDDQIAALKKQQGEVSKQVKPLEEIDNKLQELQRQAEIMDLQKSLKFDPLTRAIEKAANAMEELPFDKIMNGIRGAQSDIDKYSEKLEEANKAVERQKAVVDAATGARDRMSDRLDKEKDQLDSLKDKYQVIEQVIRDIESAMNDAASAADTMANALDAKKKGKKEYVSPGLQNFRDAKGGEFANVGGSGIPIRKNFESQADDIKKWTENLGMDTAKMFSDLDPFAPLKKKWNQFKSWASKTWDALSDGFKDFLQHAGEDVNFDGAKKSLGDLKAWVRDKWNDIWGGLKEVGKLFLPDLKKAWQGIKDAWNQVMSDLAPEIVKFKDLWEPLKQLWSELWPIIKVLAAIIGGVLLLAIKIIASVIANTLGPILEWLIGTVAAVIKVFRGLIEFWTGVFTGDFQLMWKGIKDFFGGIWDGIVAIVKGVVKTIWGIVKGIVMGIWDFFKWLYDELVGHSIVPDIVNGVIKVFKTLKVIVQWIWDHVLKPIYDGFVKLWNLVKGALELWWEGIKATWNALKMLGGWIWDNVLKPVFDKVKGLWSDYVRPEAASWFEKLKGAWSALKDLKDWFKEKVLDPIKDAFVKAWEGIRDWFSKNGSMIVKPIATVINGVISIINKMIDGLNKIAEVLPGISWNIPSVPSINVKELAAGGPVPTRAGNRGFKTAGARAIVGEGKANHPEYVVPTDPTYRNRALALHKELSQRLGVYDLPEYAKGGKLGKKKDKGIIDTIKGAVGGAKSLVSGGADWIKGNIEKLASTAFGVAKDAIDSMVGKIDWKYGREATQSVVNQVFSWVASADEAYKDKAKSAMPPIAGKRPISAGGWTNPMAGPYSVGGSIGSYPGHTGLDLPAAIGTGIRAIHDGIVSASYDLPGSNSYNNTPYRSYGRVVTVDHGGGYSSLYAHMSERIAAAGQKVQAGSMLGRVGMNGNASGPHLHLEIRSGGSLIEPRAFLNSVGVPLAKGAIVRRRSGGTLARIGEGRTDEAVTPLPRNWRSQGIGQSGGDRTVNIYGNLEFPNISSGDDAEAFIKNLESMS